MTSRILHRSASFLFAFFLAQAAFAQGLYAGSKGARTAGRGGAVGAKADDLSAMEYNPAGLARLGTTTIQLSNRFSYNQTKYTRQPTLDGGNGEIVTFDEVKNEKPWQLLEPLLAVGTNFGLDSFGFALGAYAPSGIAKASYSLGAQTDEMGGPDYKSEGGQRYMMQSRDSQILIYALSGAYKFKDVFGFGATLQWISVPKIKYSLGVAPVPFGTPRYNVRSPFDMVSEIEGHDYFTFNTVLGAWVRPLPFLELAASGQVIPSEIRAKSKLRVRQISNGQDLLLQRAATGACDPQTTPEACVNDVELTIPLPLWVRLAARIFKENEEKQLLWDLELDFVYQGWSRVKSFELTSDNLVGVLVPETLGGRYELPVGDISVPKEWRNSWQLQLGSDVAIVPERLVVRGGAGFDSAVAWKKLYTAIDFPTAEHVSVSLGGSAYFGGLELALAYAYRRQVHVTVDEGEGRVYQQAPGSPCEPPYNGDGCPYLGKPAATVNGGIYKSYSHFVTVDGIYRF